MGKLQRQCNSARMLVLNPVSGRAVDPMLQSYLFTLSLRNVSSDMPVTHSSSGTNPCASLPTRLELITTLPIRSRHHRLVEVGRDLWRSLCPTPLLKQGHLDTVAQDHVQMGSEYLQGWRLHNISGQPIPVLCHLHSKKVFRRHLLCFSVCPSPLVLSLHHWKEPGSNLFTLPSSISVHWDPPEPSLLQASPSSLGCSS